MFETPYRSAAELGFRGVRLNHVSNTVLPKSARYNTKGDVDFSRHYIEFEP